MRLNTHLTPAVSASRLMKNPEKRKRGTQAQGPINVEASRLVRVKNRKDVISRDFVSVNKNISSALVLQLRQEAPSTVSPYC